MTKIYVTGDTHGLNNIKKIHDFLNTIDGDSLTKNDYMIVLGDFGVCWYGNRSLETQRKMEKQLDEEINNIRNMPSAKALSDDDFEFYKLLKKIFIKHINLRNRIPEDEITLNIIIGFYIP